MIAGLRDYQARAIQDTYRWLNANEGNPCIVAPTGSGKSWLVAAMCEDLLKARPDGRIIVLSHVKELLVQDAEKILAAWPEAPLGIYSAGLGRKDIDAITVAGIQSIYRRADEVGHIGLIIVDEAHLINNEARGMYRSFISGLKEINPALRVIGLTATPYRLGQGMITDGGLFDALIESISIEELVERGYLARLRSKFTDMELDVEGVRKRGGEFVGDELQARVNTESANSAIVEETIRRAEGRQAWLVFCAGVGHAVSLRDAFLARGIATEIVTGDTPKEERAYILDEFKAGRVRAITNVNVLTTGFDYPNIDLLVMARPTLSPGLYLQMAGRGMRPKAGTYRDCLVLDFAGNIARHGPVTDVEPPTARDAMKQKRPVKKCPECQEAVPMRMKVCPCCGYEFPQRETKKDFELNQTEDIMGAPVRMDVHGWKWDVVNSRKNGTPMLRVTFYGNSFLDEPKALYLCLMHGGYAAEKGQRLLYSLTGRYLPEPDEFKLHDVAEDVNARKGVCPAWVEYRRRGHFYDITKWGWEAANEAAV